jgi:hypothetical protein
MKDCFLTDIALFLTIIQELCKKAPPDGDALCVYPAYPISGKRDFTVG